MAVTERKTAAKPDKEARRAPAHERIVESISEAIADRRLPPGAKLTEEPLTQAFGVSRARIRAALATLAQLGVVELRPNVGAFVARPSLEEAREVFEARRIVERGVIDRLTGDGPLGVQALSRLRAHLERERHAETANDRPAMIRLSGDFHLLMADLAGNRLLSDFLVSLVRLSSLAIAALEVRPSPDCSAHEHEEIVEALAAGDVVQVHHRMTRHLQAIEERLVPDATAPGIDLLAVFKRPVE